MKNPKWLKGKKVAIVTDWLTTYGGAEKVVKTVGDIFPQAPIFTSQYSEKEVDWFKNKDIRTGWMNVFPPKLRKIFPIFRVIYFSHLGKKLKEYDIVISICCAECKGLKLSKNQLHISYLQGPPIQYYWGMYDDYIKNPGFGKFNGIVRFFFKALVNPLRKIDYKFAQRPDLLIANSTYSSSEIKKYYKRNSKIVFPPVDINKFKLCEKKSDYFISTSRQVNWKRLDIAVEVFKELDDKLVLVGGGAEHNKLMNMARGNKNIEFIDTIKDASELQKIVGASRGFIFPSLEPFGIAPIEALVSGTPVIAYQKGGALDYIKDGENGIFFKKQTKDSLKKAVLEFKKRKFSPKKVSESAVKFSTEEFQNNFESTIKEVVDEKYSA